MIINDQGSILDKIITTQQFSRKEQFRPQEVLGEILKHLSEREAQVITRRFGLSGTEKETLESVGKSFQITRERVRQIEKLVVNKIKQSPKLHEVLTPVRMVIMETIESQEGVVTEAKLLQLLGEAGGQNIPINVIHFYLSELLDDFIRPLTDEIPKYCPAWILKTASRALLDDLLQQAFDLLEQTGKPMTDEGLGKILLDKKLVGPLGSILTDIHLILDLLEVSALIKRNPYGEWGLSSWETITPKRMSDKIYLVLKKSGQPLHFKEIANLINEQKFDHKSAYAPTVHNELILDRRFVLVGRGIYALSEWGYKPGVVVDVITNVLKDKNIPLTREQILAEVLKQRQIKPATVYLALTNRKLFLRTLEGRYQLAPGE